MKNKKELARLKRHSRIRLRMKGNLDRPRLVINRSLKNLSCQLIDDTSRKVIFSLSTLDKEMRQKFPCAGNLAASQAFGELFSRRVKEKGITKVIFDRAGYLYHGRIKAFAEALRKGGTEF